MRLILRTALLFACAWAEQSVAQIVVVGQRISGGPQVICEGAVCGQLLTQLSSGGNATFELLTEQGPLTDDPDPGFCDSLEDAKPAGCGTAPSLGPNGCGTDDPGLGEELAELLVGDLNEPVSGYSFRTPCDNHDMCWVSYAPRTQCDTTFLDDMIGVCNSHQGCEDMADNYYGAVISTFGTDAHEAAQGKLECAEWHEDMEANHCNQ